MNKIEILPKTIKYKDNYYDLNLGVTFKGRLHICYRDINRDDILSFCVEEENEPRMPKGIRVEAGFFNENIGNDTTIDNCADRIMEMIEKSEEITVFVPGRKEESSSEIVEHDKE